MPKLPVLSRRALLQAATALAAMHELACTDAARSPEPEPTLTPTGSDPSALGYDAFACAERPTAYVLPGAANDRALALRGLLEDAGFRVEALSTDRSASELRGLIVLPSYLSATKAYQSYMARFGGDLSAFVDGANVLLQLPQDAQSEPSPPFLPMTHAATRSAAATGAVEVQSPTNTLLSSMAIEDHVLAWTEEGDEVPVFVSQDGFEVVLTDESGDLPLLMEGAYGQGRFVLSALAFDASDRDRASAAIAATLFRNLFERVQAVCARTATSVALSVKGGTSQLSAGSSMIAVLPDTQVYSLRFPGLFHVQTSFLRMNAERFDIRYVVHLGDIVNNNTPTEWRRAAEAMSVLDGVVPCALVPGNHDYGPSGDASTRDTKLNDYFSFERAAAMPTFGGAFEQGKLESTYHLFSIKGRDFILIALEWGPRNEVVEWANEVMASHPNREGILVTHAYLNNDNRRYDHTDRKHSQRFNPHEYATPGPMNDGEELWQNLVRRHRFAITLNGHVLGDGNGYLASTTDYGNVCHQMLSNYQMREQGGEAYMRLLEFLDDGRTVRVFTYSPLYDKLLDEPDQNFTFVLEPVA